jgi:hypothetical protein
MVAVTARFIPSSFHVDALLVGDDGLTIGVYAETPEVRCPLCDEPAERVHSRGTRTLADLPWPEILLREPHLPPPDLQRTAGRGRCSRHPADRAPAGGAPRLSRAGGVSHASLCHA